MELTDLRSLSYSVVDVETTGTSLYGGDRIMGVEVVDVRDGLVTTGWEVVVKP